MEFSNGIIAPLIIEPLRYHFGTYTRQTGIFWDADEKKRTIDIGEAFDFNKVPLQTKPRVVVTRGGYGVGKVGITDNLAEAKPFTETGGLRDYTNMLLYQGTAVVTIEARNKGTCELVADMVSHFIAWTRPVLCDSQGWKEFGLPMGVSDCASSTDEDPDVPKFQVQIQIPWIKEEHWKYKNDGVTLKKVVQSIVPVFQA